MKEIFDMLLEKYNKNNVDFIDKYKKGKVSFDLNGVINYNNGFIDCLSTLAREYNDGEYLKYIQDKFNKNNARFAKELK